MEKCNFAFINFPEKSKKFTGFFYSSWISKIKKKTLISGL